MIEWSDVPLEHKNGEITGFVIVLYDLQKNTSDDIKIVNGDVHRLKKNDLKKYHNYSVQVAAKTTVGSGKYSSSIQIRTLEDGK